MTIDALERKLPDAFGEEAAELDRLATLASKYSGNAGIPSSGVPGQAAAEELSFISTSADGADGVSGTAPAGDGLVSSGPVPGNPNDPSGDAHEGEPSPKADSPGVDDASIGLELGSRPGADSSDPVTSDQDALVATGSEVDHPHPQVGEAAAPTSGGAAASATPEGTGTPSDELEGGGDPPIPPSSSVVAKLLRRSS